MEILDAYSNEDGITLIVKGTDDGTNVSIDIVVYRPIDHNFTEGVALYEQFIGAKE